MYCSSCGTALTPGLSYCNRCGANLSTSKDDGATKQLQAPVNSFLTAITLVTLSGLGIILGGTIVLKNIGLHEGLMFTFMLLSFFTVLAIDGLLIWQLSRLTSGAKETSGTIQLKEPRAKELGRMPAHALAEPVSSVTEHTTRTFEPIYSERKAE